MKINSTMINKCYKSEHKLSSLTKKLSVINDCWQRKKIVLSKPKPLLWVGRIHIIRRPIQNELNSIFAFFLSHVVLFRHFLSFYLFFQSLYIIVLNYMMCVHFYWSFFLTLLFCFVNFQLLACFLKRERQKIWC